MTGASVTQAWGAGGKVRMRWGWVSAAAPQQYYSAIRLEAEEEATAASYALQP